MLSPPPQPESKKKTEMIRIRNILDALHAKILIEVKRSGPNPYFVTDVKEVYFIPSI
ncbi:hypothetical protein MACH26_11240 [Planctobacterium marinum]|uniref:Uncharacterized protein n=1 Tax=Planctobacterium marinum TaxID=1631968 RepID=A0AA48HEQ6_9ALTE|nr:hypothetical protein MACH26_11240 [Planctobacterium marinum]